MIVTGCRTWYLAAVILGQDFQYRRIEYEEETAQNLIALESDFWNNHVLPRHMPDPDGSKSCDEVLESISVSGERQRPSSWSDLTRS